MKRKVVQSKHNWEAAKADFVNGFAADPANPDVLKYPTLKEISDNHQIPYQQVRAHSSNGRWAEERTAAQLEVAKKRRSDRVKKLASESERFDDQSLFIAKTMNGLIQARLVEISQELQARQDTRTRQLAELQGGEYVDPKEMRTAVWYKELNELASAASTAQQIGRKALGTDIDQIAISMEQTIDVQGTLSVKAEMERTDTDRLAQMVQIVGRATIPALGELMPGEDDGEEYDDEEPVEEIVVEAELVEEEEPANV